jgi:hypothetical protein
VLQPGKPGVAAQRVEGRIHLEVNQLASGIAADDLAWRLLIIPDLNGDVNQACIGSNPTRGAKLIRYEFSRPFG